MPGKQPINSNSNLYFIDANETNNYNPNLNDIPEEILKSTVIMYLCFPSNPQGATTTLDYLHNAINLSRRYDFILALDECYIDIYRLNEKKPIGGLDALVKINSNLKNIFFFNSLSKRSNVPGMRAGFIIGDEKIIEIYKLLVSNGASPVPIPIQHAAAALYDYQNHNIRYCRHYDKSFNLAKKNLSPYKGLKNSKTVSFFGFQ